MQDNHKVRQVGVTLNEPRIRKIEHKFKNSIYISELRFFMEFVYEPPEPPEYHDINVDEENVIEYRLRLFNKNIRMLDQLKSRYNTNRSTIMRHILVAFDAYTDHRVIRDLTYQKKNVSMYLPKGTNELLRQLFATTDGGHVIESYLLNDYNPNKNNLYLDYSYQDLKQKVIVMTQQSIDIVQRKRQDYDVKQNDVYRDVIFQLVEFATGKPFNEALKEHSSKGDVL